MVGNCYSSNIVEVHCGEGTGDRIYRTADGRYWKDADPYDVKHQPTGTSFAYKSGDHVFTKCFASSEE